MTAEQSYAQAPATDEVARQMEELMLQERMRNIGRKLLVLSGKGGVGKSTVAANLAVALARAGKKVGLLDVDVHGPSIPKLLGLEKRKVEIVPGKILPIKVDENFSVMSIGLLLDNLDDAVIWRGPRKYGVIRQFLKDVVWGRLDYMVVDSPPGTGDEPLSIAQLVGSHAAAIIVTTPQDLSISDVRRCVSFCKALSLPIAGIVENMSGYVCPKCGQRSDIFKAGGGEAMADELGLPLLGRIPIDPQVVVSGDDGAPFAAKAADFPAAQAFERVMQNILASDDRTDCGAKSEHEHKETYNMKIAIPLAGGCLCMHFGHCEQFALVETDEQNNIVSKTMLTPPAHEPGVLPAWLHEQGADVIIAGGMGSRAQQLFTQNNITVVVGASATTPEQLVAAYLNDTLETGDNVCDH